MHHVPTRARAYAGYTGGFNVPTGGGGGVASGPTPMLATSRGAPQAAAVGFGLDQRPNSEPIRAGSAAVLGVGASRDGVSGGSTRNAGGLSGLVVQGASAQGGSGAVYPVSAAVPALSSLNRVSQGAGSNSRLSSNFSASGVVMGGARHSSGGEGSQQCTSGYNSLAQLAVGSAVESWGLLGLAGFGGPVQGSGGSGSRQDSGYNGLLLAAGGGGGGSGSRRDSGYNGPLLAAAGGGGGSRRDSGYNGPLLTAAGGGGGSRRDSGYNGPLLAAAGGGGGSRRDSGFNGLLLAAGGGGGSGASGSRPNSGYNGLQPAGVTHLPANGRAPSTRDGAPAPPMLAGKLGAAAPRGGEPRAAPRTFMDAGFPTASSPGSTGQAGWTAHSHTMPPVAAYAGASGTLQPSPLLKLGATAAKGGPYLNSTTPASAAGLGHGGGAAQTRSPLVRLGSALQSELEAQERLPLSR